MVWLQDPCFLDRDANQVKDSTGESDHEVSDDSDDDDGGVTRKRRQAKAAQQAASGVVKADAAAAPGKGFKWDVVLLDEGHTIKNPKTLMVRAAGGGVHAGLHAPR